MAERRKWGSILWALFLLLWCVFGIPVCIASASVYKQNLSYEVAYDWNQLQLQGLKLRMLSPEECEPYGEGRVIEVKADFENVGGSAYDTWRPLDFIGLSEDSESACYQLHSDGDAELSYEVQDAQCVPAGKRGTMVYYVAVDEDCQSLKVKEVGVKVGGKPLTVELSLPEKNGTVSWTAG